MKNDNKGFSLIELIVVIAIMAILVGALAPQLIKYIERSRVAADQQVLGAVYTAAQTAAADPLVTLPSGGIDEDLTSIAAGDFLTEITETLGGDLSKVQSSIKSQKASGNIHVKVTSTGIVTVTCGSITVDASGSHVS